MSGDAFKCSSCPERFSTKGQRGLHVDNVHRESVDVKLKNGVRRTIARDQTGKFRCPCDRTYPSARSIQRHSKTCDFTHGASVQMTSSNDGMCHNVLLKLSTDMRSDR